MEDHLKDRQKQLDKVSTLMTDVLTVAKDLGIEVEVQDKKLDLIAEEMKEAKENVIAGTEQLEQAKNKEGSNNKILQGVVVGVGAFVLVLIFIVIIRRK